MSDTERQADQRGDNPSSVPQSRSPSRERSGSPTPKKSRSRSASRDRSTERRGDDKRRSASRSRSPSRSRSRSRSRRRSRSRSRDRRRRSRSRSRDRRRRSRSRSPRRSEPRRGRKEVADRDRPEPTHILGIFGLSLYTKEKDLLYEFERYGAVDKMQLIYDARTGRSRGFGFCYFRKVSDAEKARDAMNGTELQGRKIRVDFSVTRRAHTPTPGRYMGRPDDRDNDRGRSSRYSRSRSRSRSRGRRDRSYSR